MQSVKKLAQLAVLKKSLRSGSAEGLIRAIESGFPVAQFLDSQNRNLIMMALRKNSPQLLKIVCILADAGVDANHRDALGWNCLHHACANGAYEVVVELLRRKVEVFFNENGFGPEDFRLPQIRSATSLYQHTAQLAHENQVQKCWGFFQQTAQQQNGVVLSCQQSCEMGKPFKVNFEAPPNHNLRDRIRIVDVFSEMALDVQVSRTVQVPPGGVGTVTLDSEIFSRISTYRIYYEVFEEFCLPLEQASTLPVRDLDSGRTVSAGTVNEIVLKELDSSKSDTGAVFREKMRQEFRTYSQSVRSAITQYTQPERPKTTTCNGNSNHSWAQNKSDETQPQRTENPRTKMKSNYRILAMSSLVEVHLPKKTQSDEYEMVISEPGSIGLLLEPCTTNKHTKSIVVKESSGQAAGVVCGDLLVSIGGKNIEHAGFQHALWELNEAQRPCRLRFRRVKNNEQNKIIAQLRHMASSHSTKTLSPVAV